MAVLVEAISVVIRRPSIDRSFPGGWEAFASQQNETLCADDHLARVGFLDPIDVEEFINTLSAHGIDYLVNDEPRDLIVVDQQKGPMVPCEWLQFGRITLADSADHRVAGVRIVGDTTGLLATPETWTFEGSISSRT